ncbi:MAG: hypothetical protein QOF99_5738 [Pseudonocardiales bacterium]|jgi:hypothetical protein|nr:hypothetical protein [Pseudonocardiales bacterium]
MTRTKVRREPVKGFPSGKCATADVSVRGRQVTAGIAILYTDYSSEATHPAHALLRS